MAGLALREMFEGAEEAVRQWPLVLDLMDHTFNVALCGNQDVMALSRSPRGLCVLFARYAQISQRTVRRDLERGVRW